MPSNIEIKARLPFKEGSVHVAQRLSQTEATVLKQEDIFYNVPKGRLKLRMIEGQPLAQLISYERQNISGPKQSDFNFARIVNAQELKKVLGDSLGVLGYVKKTRFLFLVGQTRIHIDTVDGLGDFIELEVLLKDGQLPSEGEEIARDLMEKLNISSDNLIECAYVDLLLGS